MKCYKTILDPQVKLIKAIFCPKLYIGYNNGSKAVRFHCEKLREDILVTKDINPRRINPLEQCKGDNNGTGD